jgi:hypothetical protein
MIQEDDGGGPLPENLGTSHERFADKSSSGLGDADACHVYSEEN